jgi:hypothetical protein
LQRLEGRPANCLVSLEHRRIVLPISVVGATGVQAPLKGVKAGINAHLKGVEAPLKGVEAPCNPLQLCCDIIQLVVSQRACCLRPDWALLALRPGWALLAA